MSDPTGAPTPRPPGLGASLSSIRWALPVFGAVLGALLVLRGSYLFGFVVLGLAVVRLATFSGRRRLVAGLGGRGGPTTQAAVAFLRTLAPLALETAADVVRLPVEELRAEFDANRSLAEIAAERGFDRRVVAEAIASVLEARTRSMEAEERVATDVAERAIRMLPRWSARVVQLHRSELRGA